MASVTGHLTRNVIVLAVAGVVGGVAVLLGGLVSPHRALVAWLAAFASVTSLAIGALVLYLIGYAANARWLAVVRRAHEVIIGVFPILLVLFAPIALGVADLYPWADPDARWTEHEARMLEAKRAWLEPLGFAVRGFLYLGVCTVAAEVLRRRSRRRDGAGEASAVDPEATLATDRAIACGLLPLVGLAITFAGFDWIMSLDPTWASSMFGVYYFAGGFVAGIAALAIVAAWLARRARDIVTPHHFHAIGRLLFAFTVFWAYAAYFQAFLIQIADRPAEVTFYLARLDGGWTGWTLALAIGHFVVPFALLLPRRVKYRAGWVAGVAGWILAMHYADLYWLVAPSAGSLSPHWLDLAALVAVVGLSGAWCLWRQRGVPAFAVGDPFLAEGIAYRSPT